MSHFEIVRTDDGHHARFVATNGQTVWTTESYTRKAAALHAVASLVDPFIGHWVEPGRVAHRKDSWNKVDGTTVEIRYVDERVLA